MNSPTMPAARFQIRQPFWSLPGMRGVIERRMLVNFRCSPEVVGSQLPAPFRPKCVGGHAVAGICLIRLAVIRPSIMPIPIGFASENAAHRIAVEWDEAGAVREGVFIPRRDMNSHLNRLAGGRVFPGVHHAAEFQVVVGNDTFERNLRSEDGVTFIRVQARVAGVFPAGSVFRSLEEASQFFLGVSLDGRRVRSRDRVDHQEPSRGAGPAAGGWLRVSFS